MTVSTPTSVLSQWASMSYLEYTKTFFIFIQCLESVSTAKIRFTILKINICQLLTPYIFNPQAINLNVNWLSLLRLTPHDYSLVFNMIYRFVYLLYIESEPCCRSVCDKKSFHIKSRMNVYIKRYYLKVCWIIFSKLI